MDTKTTSLLAYVIDYLTEEHQRALAGEQSDTVEFINGEMVKEMVEETLDAYTGGAR